MNHVLDYSSMEEHWRRHRRQMYLLDPILPRKGILFLHAKRGIGKTHLMATVAASINHGGKLFGRYQALKSNVVLVQADTAQLEQEERLVTMNQTLPMDKLYVYFSDYVNMLDLHPGDEWVKEVNSLDPGLIIWDSLRMVFRGSMNDDDVPPVVYSTARYLFPRATHAFIHHDKKTTVDLRKQLDPDEAFRGSGAWLDHADVGIHLLEPSPQHKVLVFTKTRGCPRQDPIGITLDAERMIVHTTTSVESIAREWVDIHPHGTLEDLTNYLIASFASSVRTAERVARTFFE